MTRKKWRVVPYDKALALRLAQKTGADEFAVLLLSSRGIDTPEAITAFLGAAGAELSSPFLLKDMDKAVARIRTALERGEKILVYGDYDADGVTATALLYSYLQTLGANADYYIPSRETDGYGLSLKTAERILQGDFQLVITVDNGIAAVEEAAFLRENGIDLIVTDHHQAGRVLPDCAAVVDPHRPDDNSPCRELAGVGVALKLTAALEDGDYGTVMQMFGDLAALGTVADIVPLTGENRTIVSCGLMQLSRTDRPGLYALQKALSLEDKEISSATVAYMLAPRINAAGRMGSAETALELLLTEDPARAAALTEEMNAANAARQQTEAQILAQVEAEFAADPAAANARFLVTAGADRHPGVIGIVAAKLVEKYGRPAAVISIDEESGVCRGSCRSIEGFSLYDALSAVSDHLLQFGGHTLAAGFSLKKEALPAFTAAINAYAASVGDVCPTLDIDCRLNPAHLTADILNSLSLLEPFGAENPRPVFGLFDMTVAGIRPIGSNKHIRLTLTKNGVSVPVVCFGVTADAFEFRVGDTVDAAVRAEKNEYMGEIRLSLQLQDVRPAGSDDEAVFASIAAYHRLVRGEPLSDKEKQLLLPGRELLGKIYKLIKNEGGARLSAEALAYRIGEPSSKTGAVEASLAALTEVGVLCRTADGYRDAQPAGKADLEQSAVLQALKKR